MERISFILNGKAVTVEADPARRAVDVLREDLGLTGTKEGCGEGECGACSVLVDGVLKLSCLMAIAQFEGRKVTTIEGICREGELHPLQESFIRLGAVQCGFCTPGMIVAATHLIDANPSPTRQEIREAISGNICRCTGYQKIVDAIEDAAARISGGKTDG